MITNAIQYMHHHRKQESKDIESIEMPQTQYGNGFVYTVVCIGLIIIIGGFFL